MFGINQSKTISLELAIQLYASVYLNLAPLAKMKKSLLFNEENLPEILNNINADRIIFAFKIYTRIMKIISDYRRCIRSKQKTEILQYLGIKAKDLKQYSFLNTADIFYCLYMYKSHRKSWVLLNMLEREMR
ncbi:hypothetical protein AB432_000295 [Brevibacillus brevis]|uniref:Uncharacterized protein n=1 Tax=Brevibacillus brevis TaxID=1393 RepID=A0A2Z4MAW8_BREBE|nr:hypothetical protein [Brevibacillus brevis]AWX53623.1 hypothetical protein AB432_000295 [Brevibacillus brevis]